MNLQLHPHSEVDEAVRLWRLASSSPCTHELVALEQVVVDEEQVDDDDDGVMPILSQYYSLT